MLRATALLVTVFLLNLFLNLAAGAAPVDKSACPTKEMLGLSPACQAEIIEVIKTERVTEPLRLRLEKDLSLRHCNTLKPDALKWRFVPERDDEGPHLAVSLAFTCDPDAGYSGYTVSGRYYLDDVAPTFQLLKVELSVY